MWEPHPQKLNCKEHLYWPFLAKELPTQRGALWTPSSYISPKSPGPYRSCSSHFFSPPLVKTRSCSCFWPPQTETCGGLLLLPLPLNTWNRTLSCWRGARRLVRRLQYGASNVSITGWLNQESACHRSMRIWVWFPEPHEKSDAVAYTCNCSIGQVETGDCMGFSEQLAQVNWQAQASVWDPDSKVRQVRIEEDT